MNALNQYLTLYRDHSADIDLHSTDVLNRRRANALSQLESAGRLPERGDEGYEKTSVNEMFAPDFGVNIERYELPADVAGSFRCGVPNLSTLLGIVVNDRFAATPTLLNNLPDGVTVCSLATAARQHPELVARYYDTIADRRAALNTLLCQDGVFIHVAPGVRVDKAIQIVAIFDTAFPLMAARRVLVVAEEGSSLAVLKCDHTRPDSRECLSNEVVEIFVGKNAQVQWHDIEESSAATSRYSLLFARQDSGSELTVSAATLTNGTTRNEFHLDVAGEHTSTRLYGMAIGSERQHIDNASDVRHAAPHARSSQLFKYVLDNAAVGAFEGGIEVCPGAHHIEAYQSNRNIVASEHARMHTKPQLLIYNDDVKCSHGATTGQIDERALFYMQTRGIPRHEARRMLMQAFMADVIESITLEPLRTRLHHLVECRFAGHQQAGCGSCM